MGLISYIKGASYNFIVWTGVMNVVVDLMKSMMDSKKGGPPSRPNFEVTDAKGHKLKLTKVGQKVFPPFGEDKIESVRNIPIRQDDILLCGYPKTGCHWMYEILFMLRNGKAQLSKHGKELGGMIDGLPNILIDSIRSPRVLNSHMVYEDLPVEIKGRKTKIVLTTRNPKDTLVSFYNHHHAFKDFYGYEGEFTDYFELFMNGDVDYGDYFDYLLDWDNAVKSQVDNPILLVPYEELKADTHKWVLEAAKFLEISCTDQFAQEIIDACAFQKMKAKHESGAESAIFRKGKVGDWKSWLTDEMSDAIDKRWEEKMKNCTYQPKW